MRVGMLLKAGFAVISLAALIEAATFPMPLATEAMNPARRLFDAVSAASGLPVKAFRYRVHGYVSGFFSGAEIVFGCGSLAARDSAIIKGWVEASCKGRGTKHSYVVTGFPGAVLDYRGLGVSFVLRRLPELEREIENLLALDGSTSGTSHVGMRLKQLGFLPSHVGNIDIRGLLGRSPKDHMLIDDAEVSIQERQYINVDKLAAPDRQKIRLVLTVYRSHGDILVSAFVSHERVFGYPLDNEALESLVAHEEYV